MTKNSLKGGRLRLLLSILSLQESVKCCHQNKHFFHVAPVCCITVMSQCNTVQTPKKLCTVDKILLRNNPPCGFGLSPRSRDQPQPGSLFSRSWGGERETLGTRLRPRELPYDVTPYGAGRGEGGGGGGWCYLEKFGWVCSIVAQEGLKKL